MSASFNLFALVTFYDSHLNRSLGWPVTCFCGILLCGSETKPKELAPLMLSRLISVVPNLGGFSCFRFRPFVPHIPFDFYLVSTIAPVPPLT